MFKIMRKSEWEEFANEALLMCAEIIKIKEENEELKKENQDLTERYNKLFDFHNKRLQKPHQDNDGNWRDNEGKFAKANEELDRIIKDIKKYSEAIVEELNISLNELPNEDPRVIITREDGETEAIKINET